MGWQRVPFACLMLLSLEGMLSAGEPLPELVLQLGDARFQTRVAAEQELLGRGAEGLRLVGAGIRSGDPEIRQRSQRLLKLLQKLTFLEQRERVRNDPWTVSPELAPAWDVYQSLVGDSPAAREIYVRMIEHEPELMMSVVLRPGDWSYDFERRCADLRTFFDRRSTRDLNQASVLTLLFLSIYPDSRSSPIATGTVTSLISEAEFYNAAQRAPEEERAVYEALLSHWVQQSGNASPASRLQLAGRFQLSAGIAPAREIVTSRKSLGQSRAQLQHAIGFLARYGDLSHVADLELLLDQDRVRDLQLTPSFLSDTLDGKPAADETSSRSGPRPSGKEEVTPQDLIVNDVALLALVKLTRQNPQDYGFPTPRSDPEYRTVSNAPGFTNDLDRRKALARWLAWKIEHANELKQNTPDASEGVPL